MIELFLQNYSSPHWRKYEVRLLAFKHLRRNGQEELVYATALEF